jgi:lipopolysaccharide exporter
VGDAVRGSVMLMGRSMAGQLIAFVATIGIARLVSPAEFGLFAIALAVENAAAMIVYAGLPASLIRQEHAPTPAEQHAVAGFTLSLSCLVSGVALLVGFVVLPLAGLESTIAKLIGISCLALPLLAMRMIPAVLLSRDLRFERVALIQITSRLVLYGTALAAAAVGFGVYGLAAAIPASALASSVLASRLSPWSRGFSLDLGIVSGFARFGAKVSAFRLSNFLFELLLITILTAAGSAALAGFYAISRRVLALPFSAIGSLQTVGLPALSRVKAGATRTRQAAKAIGVSATAVGLPLALLVGAAAPLISLVFGARWLPASDILIVSSAGLMVFASFGGVVTGRALADGNPGAPLSAAMAQIGVAAILAVLLVPPLGAWGAGIAVASGYLLFGAVLLARFHDLETRRAAWTVLRALLVAALAAGCGQVIRVGDGLTELAFALAASGAAWLLLSLILTRSETKLLLSLLRRHLLYGRRREAGADLEPGPAEVV